MTRFTFRYDVRWGHGTKLQPHENGEITIVAVSEADARRQAFNQLMERFSEHARPSHELYVSVQDCLTQKVELRLSLRGMVGDGVLYLTVAPSNRDGFSGSEPAVAAFCDQLKTLGFTIERECPEPPKETP